MSKTRLTCVRYSSPSLESSKVVTDQRADLYTIAVFNNHTSSTLYVHVFDASAVPSAGAVPILAPIAVGPGQSGSIDFSHGLNCNNGIAVALSTTAVTYTAVAGNHGLLTIAYGL